MSKFKYLALVIMVFAVNSLIRLAPTLFTNMPFSNDVWPLICIVENILHNPNVNVYSLSKEFGHHVQWPYSIIESIVYIHIAGVEIIDFFKVVGVAMLSISMTLFVYVIAKKYSLNPTSSLVTSMAITLIPSFTLYTSTYLKEFYGHTLTPLLLYVFIHGSSYRSFVLLIIISIALVLSHPLASAMVISIAISYIYVNLISFLKNRGTLEVNRVKMLALVWLAALYLIYTFFIVKPIVILSTVDILILIMYTLSIYIAYLLLGGSLSAPLIGVGALLATISIIYTITIPMNSTLIFFVTPLIMSITYRVKGNCLAMLKASTLLPITTLYLYISTYMVETLPIIHRVMNYLVYTVIPVIISIVKSSKTFKYIALASLVSFSIVCTSLTILGLNPYTFYWRYGEHDYFLKNFIMKYVVREDLYGDPKYSYMLVMVKSFPIEIFKNICNIHGELIISKDNFNYGVPISAVDFYKLNDNLLRCRNLVLNTGQVYVIS